MTEGFETFYFITILRTDISSSRTKPTGLISSTHKIKTATKSILKSMEDVNEEGNKIALEFILEQHFMPEK
jgi:hypothetical protein